MPRRKRGIFVSLRPAAWPPLAARSPGSEKPGLRHQKIMRYFALRYVPPK